MDEERIENLFRDKLANLSGLPPGVSWNSEKGWLGYEKQYLKKTPRIKMLLYTASAAAVLLIIMSVILFQKRSDSMISITNDSSEIREVQLPDGNRVWLRQNSSVEFPLRLNRLPIEITVTGEAYFEVSIPPESVYEIRAYNAVILAENDCSFNIRGSEELDHVEITPAKGALKVRDISYSEGLTLLVPEGNYCSVHKSQNLVYSSVNTNKNFLSWKTGVLTFKDTPVASVTDILSEYYHTKIELEDETLAYCRFTGTFSDQSIHKVFDQMQNDLNIEIRNTGDRFTISGKGCNKL